VCVFSDSIDSLEKHIEKKRLHVPKINDSLLYECCGERNAADEVITNDDVDECDNKTEYTVIIMKD